MKFNKIVLIGMRGCGKSHFASCLAKELKWKKIDTDDEIVKKSGNEISEIVKIHGWNTFRDLEHDICKEVSQKKNVVISTGGGAITFKRNQDILHKNSITVFLFVNFKTLITRLEKRESKNKRPSLTNKISISDEIRQIWEERVDIYFDNADIVFKAKDDLSKNAKINVEKNAKILAKKIKKLLL
jgi:shikimate kinase